MRTRKAGDLEVSVVGVGCNNFGRRIGAEETDAVVAEALDVGITLFDTADAYGDTRSEELLASALAGRRDQAVVATKFGMELDGDPQRSGASPRWVRQACEDSLRRLDTDHIDLYQLHRPDDTTPIADTLGALGELVAAGKVRQVGCSNFSAVQLDEAQVLTADGLPSFVTLQNHWSLLHRGPETDGVIEACARHGVGVLPYYPLASGLLTGKYRRDQEPPAGTRLGGMTAEQRARWVDDRRWDVVEALTAFADQRGRTVLDVAIAWLVAHEVTASVIAGATKPEQVRANAHAGSWELTSAEVTEVSQIAAPVRDLV